MHTKAEQTESTEAIRKWVKPGDTLYAKLEHVSRSGMMRAIQVIKLHKGEPVYLGFNAARVVGWSYDRKKEGVRVSGCGMDMGFHLIYSLSHCLYRNGFGCIGDKCPSNDHSNGDRDYQKHSKAKPHWHKDGGYALKHRWI